MVPRVIMAAVVCLQLGSSAVAAPPTITEVLPRGAEGGKPVTVVVRGANLSPKAQLICPFSISQRLLADAKPTPTQVRFEITVPVSVPVGIYPLRVLTEDGISPLTLFGIDVFPPAQEVEGNDSFDKAQKVPFPVIITGQCGGGDVDYYRFHVRKGQRVVIETEAARLGSGVLPQIRVTDERQRLIAADQAQKLKGDCRVWFIAPEEGDYIVEFSDSRYRGAAPPHYRLKIADYDFAEEIFPLGGRQGDKVDFTLHGGDLPADVRFSRLLAPLAIPALHPALRLLNLNGALKPGMIAPEIAVGGYPEQVGGKNGKGQQVRPPTTINGRLARRGDVHRYRFAVHKDQRYHIGLAAEALGSYLDGVLRVTDQTGKQLSRVDDIDLPPLAPGQPGVKTADPELDVTVPDKVSELVVEVRDGLGRGGVNFGYRLTIEPTQGDFTLEQSAGEINVPADGSALVAIAVRRRGYTGPIQLTPSGLPAGWSWQGGYVPAGGMAGLLTISTSRPASTSKPLTLRIVGSAIGNDGIPRALAEQHLVLSRDGNVAASTLRLGQLAAALSGKSPFSIQTPSSVELVQGYATSVPISVQRNMTPAVPIEVTTTSVPAGTPPPPAGVTAKPVTLAANGERTTLSVNAAAAIPEGRAADLVVQAKAKINNQDEVVVGPATSVTVVRPFTIEIANLLLTLKPGQAGMIKGKIQRRPVFRESVQLKLDGLPAGLSLVAPLRPIAPEQSDFQIELRADAKAAAAAAKPRLTCSATINGTVCSHPAVVLTIETKR